MTEQNDELLLEQFFQPLCEMTIEDDGFTQRVARRLPGRERRVSMWWTAACVVLGLVLFTACGGWQALGAWGLHLLTTMPSPLQLAQLWLVLLVLSALALTSILQREHIRLTI